MDIKYNTAEPAWIEKQRTQAQRKFNDLPSPNFRYGLTVRMDISDLNLEQIKLAQNPDPNELNVVLPDTAKKAGVIAVPIQSADEKRASAHFMKLFKIEHKISALHAAKWTSAVFIYIPKNTKLSEPIKIHHNTASTSSFNHVLIIIDQNSSAEIIQSCTANNAYMTGTATEIYLKDNAKITHTSVQNYPIKTYYFDQKTALVGKDSSITWNDIHQGAKFTQSTIHANLAGPSSSAAITTFFVQKQDQQFDLAASVHHYASNTTSAITAKGAIADKAKNIYRGTITIAPHAQNSTGTQKEDIILLSPTAEPDSIPKLVIDNNNVKCRHAATIGHIDENKLFYLTSRGLNETQAKKLIISGFLNSPELEGAIEEL